MTEKSKKRLLEEHHSSYLKRIQSSFYPVSRGYHIFSMKNYDQVQFTLTNPISSDQSMSGRLVSNCG